MEEITSTELKQRLDQGDEGVQPSDAVVDLGGVHEGFGRCLIGHRARS